MPVVEVPGVGNVEFPDSMSNEQIGAAIKAHGGPEPTEQPGTLSKAASATGQFLRGLVPDTIKGAYNTAKEALPHPDLTGSEVTDAKSMIDKGDYLGAAKRLVSNAVESLPGGKFITGAVHNAIDEAGKAREAYSKGDIAGTAKHAADAIPVVGPTIRGLAETGSVEGENNPARMLGQVAALAAGPKIAEAIPAAAGKAASAAADLAPDALRTSAEADYARVLNPTTKGNKIRTARVVPELIDRGVTALTTKGLQAKALEGVQGAVQQLNDAYENLPADASIPLKDVQARLLDAAKQEFTVPTGAKNTEGIPAGQISMSKLADAGLSHADDLAQRLTGVAVPDPATGELSIPVATARRMRQYYDEVAKLGGRYDGKALADHSEAAAHGMAADAIREQLAQDYPDIAKINAEYSLWKDTSQVLGDTLARRQGQAKPLGVKMAKAAGTAAGFTTGGIHGAILGRAAMGALESVIASPGWRTATAVAKDRLADAIAGGNAGKITFYAQKIKAADAAKNQLQPTEVGVGE